MKQNSEYLVQKFNSISRKIFVSFLVLFFLGGAIGASLRSLHVTWKWLEIISIILLAISVLLLAISWITPGILILLRVPWLAHAWLRGINPVAISDTPWKQLSGFQKFYFCFMSIVISGITLFGIVTFTLQGIRGW
jgi:hypothetical protein